MYHRASLSDLVLYDAMLMITLLLCLKNVTLTLEHVSLIADNNY